MINPQSSNLLAQHDEGLVITVDKDRSPAAIIIAKFDEDGDSLLARLLEDLLTNLRRSAHHKKSRFYEPAASITAPAGL